MSVWCSLIHEELEQEKIQQSVTVKDEEEEKSGEDFSDKIKNNHKAEKSVSLETKGSRSFCFF